jgi:peroxiredoxin Q/BCP
MTSVKALSLSLVLVAAVMITLSARAADVPAVGAVAPEFKLTSNESKQVSLKDFPGKWVVLYFYPKDFTSGCTMEARNFQRDLAKYEQAGAVILGVSIDTAESHKDFCAKEGLSFKLLSDPDAKVSGEYGSIMDYEGRNTLRVTRSSLIRMERSRRFSWV